MKIKTIKISLVFLGLVIVMFSVFFSKKNLLDSMKIVNDLNEEILDLEKEKKEGGENTRYNLLFTMTTDDEHFANYSRYEREHLYQLDDNDPSSKVIIGTYPADEFGKNGGIIFLKKLDNGKFSIFWEIKSPYFWNGSAYAPKIIDINNDGLKELILEWPSAESTNSESIKDYWFITLDYKNKKYKVLNPVINNNEEEENTDANFEVRDVNRRFKNLQSSTLHSSDHMIQDVDSDGINEILMFYQFTEDQLIRKTIYKWNGERYSFWKKEVIPFDPKL